MQYPSAMLSLKFMNRPYDETRICAWNEHVKCYVRANEHPDKLGTAMSSVTASIRNDEDYVFVGMSIVNDVHYLIHLLEDDYHDADGWRVQGRDAEMTLGFMNRPYDETRMCAWDEHVKQFVKASKHPDELGVAMSSAAASIRNDEDRISVGTTLMNDVTYLVRSLENDHRDGSRWCVRKMDETFSLAYKQLEMNFPTPKEWLAIRSRDVGASSWPFHHRCGACFTVPFVYGHYYRHARGPPVYHMTFTLPNIGYVYIPNEEDDDEVGSRRHTGERTEVGDICPADMFEIRRFAVAYLGWDYDLTSSYDHETDHMNIAFSSLDKVGECKIIKIVTIRFENMHPTTLNPEDFYD